MKNIHDVLRSKEQQLQQLQQQAQQVQKEIDTLRSAIRLLTEDSEEATEHAGSSSSAPGMIMRPAQAAGQAGKETLVAPSAWDVTKPQFP